MKHTDFFLKTRAIKAQEYKELYEAVKAHGGQYEWDFESDVEHPIIAVNAGGLLPNPTDVEIKSVAIVDEDLVIEGEDKEWGEDIYFNPEDAFAGHLSSIIDYLPETDDVKDVTVKETFELYNEWFGGLSFIEMERITGFRQLEFSPEDGYQDFVDTCENWWFNMKEEERIEIYKQFQ